MSIKVKGDGNTVAGRDVVVNINQHPIRQKVVVQPGAECIDGQQKLELKELCYEWVALHNNIKKRPLTYGAAWSRINKAAGQTSYALILKEDFSKATTYVKREMAKLRNMKSAPRKDDQWRTKKIGAIKARCTNNLGDPKAYLAYIKKNFQQESLAGLSHDELQRTYTYVFNKK